jgi:8-oxo-dGTP diphosphatase
MTKTVLVSAVALFDADGRVLLTQRPEGKSMAGLWEFPGGKVEAGELPEAALTREIREELGVEICERCASPLTFVSHPYENFHLLMLLYVCRKWEGIPQSLEGQALTWKFPREMAALPMPPADVPLVTALMDSIHA